MVDKTEVRERPASYRLRPVRRGIGRRQGRWCLRLVNEYGVERRVCSRHAGVVDGRTDVEQEFWGKLSNNRGTHEFDGSGRRGRRRVDMVDYIGTVLD